MEIFWGREEINLSPVVKGCVYINNITDFFKAYDDKIVIFFEYSEDIFDVKPNSSPHTQVYFPWVAHQDRLLVGR